MRKGYWIATEEFTGTAGFHINGIYSPWTPLADAVRDFLSAKKLPETLRVWTNVYLAETWEDQGERVDDYAVAERAETFGDEIDEEVVLITAGIDVQDDRIEIEIVGWGRDEESWSIDYRTLYGDPSTPQLWQDLNATLAQTFKTEDGRDLAIRSACIDSGGHYTQAVYNLSGHGKENAFLRSKAWQAKTGQSLSRPTRNNIGKIKLFTIGVDAAKELIFSRLKITMAGPGFMHFPDDRAG